MSTEVSLRDYLESRLRNIEEKIDDQTELVRQHLGNVEKLESRIRKLEMSSAFSSGKLWMVMAIFAVIPTILALIALFRG